MQYAGDQFTSGVATADSDGKPIVVQMARVVATLNELERATSALSDRLTPVSNQVPTSQPLEAQKRDTAGEAPLLAQLRGIEDQLNNLVLGITSMTDLLAI